MPILHLQCSLYHMPFISCFKMPFISVSYSAFLPPLHLSWSLTHRANPMIRPLPFHVHSARLCWIHLSCRIMTLHHDSLLHITSKINSMAQASGYLVIYTASLNSPENKSEREQSSQCFFYIPCLFPSQLFP